MRFWTAMLVCVLLGFASACGGGSKDDDEDPMEGGDADLSIVTLAFPTLLEGDDVDRVIDLRGGCGGPYTMEVLSGNLPAGLMADTAVLDDGMGTMTFRHHLVGLLCQRGIFSFTLRVTDNGCAEVKTATRQLEWTIDAGPLRLRKSDPPMIRAGDYADAMKWPLLDVLPPHKINTPAQIQLLPLGGLPPYSVTVIDDMADPDDDANAAAQHGRQRAQRHPGHPDELRPGGRPWRVSFLVTDAQNDTCICKLQWPIVP